MPIALRNIYSIFFYKYYLSFDLREWISQSNVTSKVKTAMRDVMRNPFRAKHINDRMFIIEELVRLRHIMSMIGCLLRNL